VYQGLEAKKAANPSVGLVAFFCVSYFAFVEGLIAEAGLSHRRASSFLLLRQKKGTKEKATLLPASLWFLLRKTQAGNLRCSPVGCAAELTALLRRSVQTAAES